MADDTKELDLTNAGQAPHRLRDSDGNMVTINPGETRKVRLSNDFATNLQTYADRGSTLIVGGPTKAMKDASAAKAKADADAAAAAKAQADADAAAAAAADAAAKKR